VSDPLGPPDPAPPLLAKPKDEPSPWDWAGCSGAGAAQLGEQLREFVAYLNGRYAWGTEHTVPPCWAAHGALVEELTTLMWSRWSAFEGPAATPEAAQAWHTYYLSGFMARMSTWVGRQAVGECRAGNHEPSRLGPASREVLRFTGLRTSQ